MVQVKRSDADKESMMVAFESPSLAFIGLRGLDLALLICRLLFDILFHGDKLHVGDLFRDMHKPSNLTLTGLDSSKVFDPLVAVVYCIPLRDARVFGDFHAQERDVQVRSEGALAVREVPRDGVRHGVMGASFLVHLEAVSHQYERTQTIEAVSQAEYPAQCLVIGAEVELLHLLALLEDLGCPNNGQALLFPGE